MGTARTFPLLHKDLPIRGVYEADRREDIVCVVYWAVEDEVSSYGYWKAVRN